MRGHSAPLFGRLKSGRAVTQHTHERNDARAAGDQEERAAFRSLPDEITADRAAQLERIADAQLAAQVRRHFAVLELLDGERKVLLLRR